MQTTDSLLARITTDPLVLVGKPVIRGMRISVQQILKALAAGITPEELMEEYPDLEPLDFQAVLLYAADIVTEHRVYKMSA